MQNANSAKMIFTYLHLGQCLNIIKYSKKIQSYLNITKDHYVVGNYIRSLKEKISKNYNLKFFEKLEKNIKKKFPEVPYRVIVNSLYHYIIQEYDLVAMNITPTSVMNVKHPVPCISQCSKNGNIISASEDNVIRIWDPKTGTCETKLENEHTKLVRFLLQLQDPQFLLCLTWDLRAILWDIPHQVSEQLSTKDDLVCSAIQLKNLNLVFGCEDSSIKIYNLQLRMVVYQFSISNGAVRCLCELADERMAVGGIFADITIWNINKRSVDGIIEGHNGTVLTLIQMQNGDLVSGAGDRLIKIWNINTLKEKMCLAGHKDVVCGIFEKKDESDKLISISEDNVIKLWDLKTRQPLFSMVHCHQDILYTYIFLSEGKIATASMDGYIKIWDVDYIQKNLFRHDKLMEYYLRDSNTQRRPYEYKAFVLLNTISAPY